MSATQTQKINPSIDSPLHVRSSPSRSLCPDSLSFIYTSSYLFPLASCSSFSPTVEKSKVIRLFTNVFLDFEKSGILSVLKVTFP